MERATLSDRMRIRRAHNFLTASYFYTFLHVKSVKRQASQQTEWLHLKQDLFKHVLQNMHDTQSQRM